MTSIRAIGRLIAESIERLRAQRIDDLTKELDALRANLSPDELAAVEGSSPDSSGSTGAALRLLRISLDDRERDSNKANRYLSIRNQIDDLKRLDVRDVLHLTVEEKKGEGVSGEVESVMDDIDRRTALLLLFKSDGLSSIRMSSKTMAVDDGLVVRLGEDNAGSLGFAPGRAVRIYVASPSTSWARATFSHLCDELEKGVPRWHFLRKASWYAVLTLAYVVIPIAALAIALPVKEKSVDYWWGFGLGVVPIYAVGVLTGLWLRLTNWLFPPFEICSDGAQPSGTRRIVALGLLLASVPIGIFVNAVS